MDIEVQKYVLALRKAGTPVNTDIVIAAAKGIVTTKDRTMLAENGGSIHLTKTWAASLMERMTFVKQRGSTARKSTLTELEFQACREKFITSVANLIHRNNIPPPLIINWDQTGLNVNIVPSSTYTMEERGCCRVEIVGLGD